MKVTRIITAIFAATLTLAASGCADLVGIGVDYGPSGIPPVYYTPDYYVPSTPFWGVSTPLPPPVWGAPVRPAPSFRPPVAPPQNKPGNNGNQGGNVNIPTHIGGQQRPGNGGLPTPGSINSSPAPANTGSNNSRR